MSFLSAYSPCRTRGAARSRPKPNFPLLAGLGAPVCLAQGTRAYWRFRPPIFDKRNTSYRLPKRQEDPRPAVKGPRSPLSPAPAARTGFSASPVAPRAAGREGWRADGQLPQHSLFANLLATSSSTRSSDPSHCPICQSLTSFDTAPTAAVCTTDAPLLSCREPNPISTGPPPLRDPTMPRPYDTPPLICCSLCCGHSKFSGSLCVGHVYYLQHKRDVEADRRDEIAQGNLLSVCGLRSQSLPQRQGHRRWFQLM